MKRKKHSIFLSYRRDGGDLSAKIIYDSLTKEGYSVFMDIESLRSGKFSEALKEKIDECDDFLLILPKGALNRCIDENDWVRREIEYALSKGKNIIPIFLRGFEWPDDDTLPNSLQGLKLYNGIAANSEYFDQSMKRIKTFLNTENPKKKRRRRIRNIILIVIIYSIVAVIGFLAGYYSGEDSDGENSGEVNEQKYLDPDVVIDISTDPNVVGQ